MYGEYIFRKQIYKVITQKRDVHLFDMDINGSKYHVEMKLMHNGMIIFTANNKTYTVYVSDDGDSTGFISMNGVTVEIRDRHIDDPELSDENFAGIGVEDENEIRSPIPGKVVKVPVRPGSKVKKGDTLLIVEAMKMENMIFAPKDAVVEKVNVEEGEAVDSNKPLIILKEE
jgi:biotin carboxyl carrier protein